VKIRASAADRLIAAPDAALRAVLLHGPDSGLIRERGAKLVRAVVDDPRDPFRVVEFAAALLKDDPARLADEADAMSLLGGRRVVRLRGANDDTTALLESTLAGPGDALIVVEAGDLKGRSSLRKLFEGAANAAAVGCYADDGRNLQRVISETLSARDIAIDAEAVRFLCDHLGSDRMVSRAELEKLTLYIGPGGRARLEDVRAIIGDNVAQTGEDLAYAAAGGDTRAVTIGLRRAFAEGAAAVTLLRAVTRHFLQLDLAAGLAAAGQPVDQAMRAVRPPLFFKRTDGFRQQLARWSPVAIAAVLDELMAAEMRCKTTGMPADTLCERALLRIAGRAAAARRRSAA
jgi:DNA polymerase III subunit delta